MFTLVLCPKGEAALIWLGCSYSVFITKLICIDLCCCTGTPGVTVWTGSLHYPATTFEYITQHANWLTTPSTLKDI